MIGALVLAVAAAGAAPEPSYLVERVVRAGDEMRRTSVFRNGAAVLVRESGGTRTKLLRQQLTGVELQVITQVADEAYPELQRFSPPVAGPGLGTVELRLAPPGREPLVVRLQLGSVASLAAAKITQALDALEADMSRFGGREDLREWRPQVGEQVELDDGRTVRILEVLESEGGAVLRLQVGEAPVSIYMSEAELRRVAVRRVAQ